MEHFAKVFPEFSPEKKTLIIWHMSFTRHVNNISHCAQKSAIKNQRFQNELKQFSSTCPRLNFSAISALIVIMFSIILLSVHICLPVRFFRFLFLCLLMDCRRDTWDNVDAKRKHKHKQCIYHLTFTNTFFK